MPFHRPCVPVTYTLSTPDPHRVIHRLTADQVSTTATFSIPHGPWTVFMFAAIDEHGPIMEPFSVSWSSAPLFPQQWYIVPNESTDLQDLHLSRGSPCPYQIILLLVQSACEESPSKPLTH